MLAQDPTTGELHEVPDMTPYGYADYPQYSGYGLLPGLIRTITSPIRRLFSPPRRPVIHQPAPVVRPIVRPIYRPIIRPSVPQPYPYAVPQPYPAPGPWGPPPPAFGPAPYGPSPYGPPPPWRRGPWWRRGMFPGMYPPFGPQSSTGGSRRRRRRRGARRSWS